MSQEPNNTQQMKQMNNQQQVQEIDLLELLMYFRTKLVVIIAGLLVGAIIAGSYTYFMIAPKYTATAKMYMVAASSDSVINLTDLNLGTSLSNDYAELMKIHPIIDTVIEDLCLDYTYEQMMDMISISTIQNTRIVKITTVSTDPEEARDISNAVAAETVRVLPDLMETTAPNIAEEALVPRHKSSPSLSKNTMVGGLLGAILVMGVYTVFFLLDDTMKSAEDVQKALGIMPLTLIPEGDIEEISDKKEEEIEKERKKRRKERKKQQKKEEK